MKAFVFVFSKTFAISAFVAKFILKNISTKKESEEADEFMTLKNVWAKDLGKNFQKNFMDFVCFSI